MEMLAYCREDLALNETVNFLLLSLLSFIMKGRYLMQTVITQSSDEIAGFVPPVTVY